jgi:ribokinase
MNYDILTIGGVMRDIIFLTKEGQVIDTPENPLQTKLIGFELGAKVYVDKVYFEPGGGACNTAVGFSKLGLKSIMMGRIGEDREGQQLLKKLKQNRIGTKLIQIDKKNSTGFSFILGLKKVKRAHVILAYRGANDALSFKIKKQDLKGLPWLYLSSLSLPAWEDFLNHVFSLTDSQTKIAWNPSNVQLKAGFKKINKYLKKTSVLILNEDEARELVLSRKKVKDLKVKNLLKELSFMGPQIVVITCGKKGAQAYANKFYYQGPAPAKVINTTGAGDSFSSGFVSSLFYHPEDIKKALKWGVFNSASVISQIGAQKGFLNKKQISQVIKK